MAYQLEKEPDASIVICTMREDYDMAADAPNFAREFSMMAESFTEPVYLVMVEEGYTPGFSDILVGASVATRGEHPVFRHPRVRQVLYVTADKLSQTALKGLSSPVFGETMVRVFATKEEAMAYARSQLASSQAS